jgi:flavorubredoxin
MADCGAFVAGSPTHNNGMLPGMAGVLTYMKGLRPLNRIGAAFGSYGWSGEAPGLIHGWLASMGMEIPAEPLKVRFMPEQEDIQRCRDLGAAVAGVLKAKAAG